MSAFRLSKHDIEQRMEHVANLNNAFGVLSTAIDTYNAQVEDLQGAVTEALEAYNNALNDARSWCEDIASAAESAYDEKSEKWQEGEKGQEASEFKDAWQGVYLDDVEVTFPDALETPDVSHANDIEELPEEAGQ